MEQIKLSDLLKQSIVSNESFNPFSDDFDFNAISEYIKDREKESGSGEKLNLDAESTVEFLLILTQLNEFHCEIVDRIEEGVARLPLTIPEIIERLLLIGNYQSHVIVDLYQEELEKSTGTVEHLYNFIQRDISGPAGQPVNSADAADAVPDILHELVAIINTLDPDYKSQPVATAIDNAIAALFRVGNLYYNIKSAFDLFKFEPGDVTYKDGKIYFQYVPEQYHILKYAGKLRQQNIQMQGVSLMSQRYAHQLKKPSFTFNKHYIFPLVSNEPLEGITPFNYYTLVPTFYFFLNEKKLKPFGGTSLNEIAQFLLSLATVFDFRTEDFQKGNRDGKMKADEIPYKIYKKHLKAYLSKTTKLPLKTIESLLQVFTQNFNSSESFWRKPLLQRGDTYYFPSPATIQAVPFYHVDIILERAFNNANLVHFFKNQLIADLKPHEKGYQFEPLKEEKIERILSNYPEILVYRTRDRILVMHLCIVSYPLEPEEFYSNFVRLTQKSETLNACKKDIAACLANGEDSKLNIQGILLLNHALHTGIWIDGNIVSDATLISNYFYTGGLNAATMRFNGNQAFTDEYSTLSYYSDEDSFNKNLLPFLYFPAPIKNILKSIKLTSGAISFPNMSPEIISDGIEHIALRTSIHGTVSELAAYLKQSFYFEDDLEKAFSRDDEDLIEAKQEIESKIAYLYPIVFNFYASDNADRNTRWDLYNAFKDIGIHGEVQLLFIFRNLLHTFSGKPVYEKKDAPEKIDGNFAKARNQLDDLMNLLQQETELTPTGFIPDYPIPDNDVNALLDLIKFSFSNVQTQVMTDKELNFVMALLTLFICVARTHDDYYPDIVTFFLNTIDLFNYNNRYQKARDIAEEALAFSFERPNRHIEWLPMFRCYTTQRNILDAGFYGCLYFSQLIQQTEVDDETAFQAYYQALLFFRNMGDSETTGLLYETLQSFEINTYDEQKVTLSYFHAQTKNLLDNDALLEEIEEYLGSKISDILAFGQKAVVPWLTLLYNWTNLQQLKATRLSDKLISLIGQLEQNVDEDTLATLKGTFFSMSEKSASVLTGAVFHLIETRDVNDFYSEIENLQLIADNVVELAIKEQNVEMLLFAGIVINDISLTFFQSPETSIFSESIKLTGNDPKKLPELYFSKILKALTIKEGQLFLWLIEAMNKVYYLTIDHNKKFLAGALPNWDIVRLRTWLSNIDEFSFEDGEFPIDMQEDAYLRQLRALDFTAIPIPGGTKELLFCTTIKLSSLPANLILGNFEEMPDPSSLHEGSVKHHLESHPADFVSFHLPVCNVVSPEWYALHCEAVTIEHSPTLEAWIPTDDNDTVLHIAYDKLKPLIIDELGSKIQTSIIPEQKLLSDINVFVAHGGKGLEGFRGVYTKHQKGHAIAKGKGTAKVFGSGIIAVVFICNSAYVEKSIFAQKVTSFVYELLSIGYQTVIAPAWNYNPDISPLWLRAFLQKFNEGISVSQATQIANTEVARQGYNEYHGYYAPAGWAALHVYGNPNVYVHIKN